MPSAHTATIVALTTVIGLIDGPGSGLFGLAVVLAAVVMYDAVMVRRSSGDQGEVLSRLVKELSKDIKLPFFAKGHSPVEVIVGAVIGICVGYVVFFATI
jgi:acid phosphatase family membrane protein YuiD